MNTVPAYKEEVEDYFGKHLGTLGSVWGTPVRQCKECFALVSWDDTVVKHLIWHGIFNPWTKDNT